MVKWIDIRFDLYVCLVRDISRSSETTQTCKQGRSAAIRLRCDPALTAKDQITLPRYLTPQPSSVFWLSSLNKVAPWRNIFSTRSFQTSLLLCLPPQKLFRRDVWWLCVPPPVAEPACMSTLHPKPLQRNRQRLYPGNTGRDQNHFTSSTPQIHHRSTRNSSCVTINTDRF